MTRKTLDKQNNLVVREVVLQLRIEVFDAEGSFWFRVVSVFSPPHEEHKGMIVSSRVVEADHW